jgi:TonB family protein
MRVSLLAGLLLAPVLVHAQGTQATSGQLSARLAAPSNPAVAPAAAANRTSTTAVRVSTGVTPPQILEQSTIQTNRVGFATVLSGAEIDVKLTVDEKGQPQNVSVVKPVNEAFDAAVISALKQYKFKPAMLDNQPVAMDMNIHVILER